jgi:hypothetical protein
VRFGPNATLLIDSNLLVVLAISLVDPAQVPRFKRTAQYSDADTELLARFVAAFGKLAVTPHILTEVSNMVGQLHDPLLTRVRQVLARFATESRELFTDSRLVVLDDLFLRFGLTDAAIKLATCEDMTVLTDDLPLYLTLNHVGVEAVNFNHLRGEQWGIGGGSHWPV